jgi:hypothetical protein
MVFIKGAWRDPWDLMYRDPETYGKYFCGGNGCGIQIAHRESFNPATGKGEKHDPPCWVTFHCSRLNEREIPAEPGIRGMEVIRPDWCPLRKQ